MTTALDHEKKIKRLVHGVPQEITIRFAKGWGEVCANEVEQLLQTGIVPQKFPPEVIRSDTAIIVRQLGYRNMLELIARLTTARDVLWTLGSGKADNKERFERTLERIPWQLLLHQDAVIALKVNSRSSHLYHEGRLTTAAAKILEKQGFAIATKKTAEQLCELLLEHDNLRVSLSLAGKPLYFRGYKSALKSQASLKEDLAACAVRLVREWVTATTQSPFSPDSILVPFAGSGTLGFEALLSLYEMAPWTMGRSYAFESFRSTPPATQRFLQDRLAESAAKSPKLCHLTFIDNSSVQCHALKENMPFFLSKMPKSLSQNIKMQLIEGDFFQEIKHLPQPKEDTLCLLNPPYGDRLASKNDARRIYDRTTRILNDLLASSASKGVIFAGAILVPLELYPFTREALKSWPLMEQAFSHGGRRTICLAFHSLKILAAPNSTGS